MRNPSHAAMIGTTDSGITNSSLMLPPKRFTTKSAITHAIA